MSGKQPEALRLYDSYEDNHTDGEYSFVDQWMVSAADELKRQHDLLQVLSTALKEIRNEAEVFGGGFAGWLINVVDDAMEAQQ